MSDPEQRDWRPNFLGKGGGGVTISHFPYPVLPPPVLFCPFVSRLPPFIVFLPLPCKSCCLTSYSNREGVLWPSLRNKNCVVSRTTPHSPARSLKRHSFDTSLHHAAKSSAFCELKSYGASSQEGLPWTDFSPPHPKIPRPIRMVFDLPRTQTSLFRWNVCANEGGKVVFDLTTFDLTRFVVFTENFDS